MRMKKRRMQNKNGNIHKHMMKKKSRVKRQNSAPGLLQLLFGVAYQDNVQGVSTRNVNRYIHSYLDVNPNFA